jgi:hypothetical protein
LPFAARRATRRTSLTLVLAALVAGGCASVAPPQPGAPEQPPGPFTPASPSPSAAKPAPPPPANVNLQGFPLPYRQGYADGCASASGSERKDATRFKGDGQYRTGWQDGNALCQK